MAKSRKISDGYGLGCNYGNADVIYLCALTDSNVVSGDCVCFLYKNWGRKGGEC